MPTAAGPLPHLGRAEALALTVKAGVGQLKGARARERPQPLGTAVLHVVEHSRAGSGGMGTSELPLPLPLASCSTV